MSLVNGTLVEIWMDAGGTAGRITCPPALRPAPGQFVWARAAAASETEVTATLLFPGQEPGGSAPEERAAARMSWVTAPGLPPTWSPGLPLELRGPLGNGFNLPASPAVTRLALVVFGETAARLLPLSGPVLARGAAVTLLTDLPVPPGLSPSIEVSPLSGLAEILAWADFLVVDLPLAALAQSVARLHTVAGGRLSQPGQALVHTAMPCWGMGDCGVCALHTRRGWKQACKDGPVFDLSDLEGE